MNKSKSKSRLKVNTGPFIKKLDLRAIAEINTKELLVSNPIITYLFNSATSFILQQVFEKSTKRAKIGQGSNATHWEGSSGVYIR